MPLFTLTTAPDTYHHHLPLSPPCHSAAPVDVLAAQRAYGLSTPPTPTLMTRAYRSWHSMGMPSTRTLVNSLNTRNSAKVLMVISGKQPTQWKSIDWPRAMTIFPGPTPCFSSLSLLSRRANVPHIYALSAHTGLKKPSHTAYAGPWAATRSNISGTSAPKLPTSSPRNFSSIASSPHRAHDA